MWGIKVLVLLCSQLAWTQAGDIWEILLDTLKCDISADYNLTVSEVKVYMYDFANNINSSFYINETATFFESYDNFEANRTTIVYIPGFDEPIDGQYNKQVLTNLANVSNCYLYLMDHTAYTYIDYFEVVSSYLRSVKYCYDIGKAIGKFFVDLINYCGIDYTNSIIAGHSLGAHMMGTAGVTFTNLTNNKFPKMKGIDPAGPCFTADDVVLKLLSGQADIVEFYHCNMHDFGTYRNDGDINCYINGGSNQPGCGEPLMPDLILSGLADICSHNACPKYVMDNGIWEAYPCDDDDTCSKLIKSANETVIAGLYSNITNSGLYYFVTD